MDLSHVAYCKIHPAIGIARVGNSPSEFFCGPEQPGVYVPPEGGYKDGGDPAAYIPPRLKRQGARFRVYGYDEDGRCLGEITNRDLKAQSAGRGEFEADITWTVTLANKKAAYHEFRGRAGEDAAHPSAPLRNKDIMGPARKDLEITPPPVEISGRRASAAFDIELFLGQAPVQLGKLRTDDHGRLIVLGGLGKSGTVDQTMRIRTYANNDRWYDDVADGPVTAVVKRPDGTTIETVGSWVLVAPPDFAPPITDIVTMYDVVYEVATVKKLVTPPERPSFTRHIYPMLSRLTALQWVNRSALVGHGAALLAHTGQVHGLFLLDPALLAKLADPTSPEGAALRKEIFDRLRNPEVDPNGEIARAQANPTYMPPLGGDGGDPIAWDPAHPGPGPFQPERWLTVTKLQYRWFAEWSKGNFEADWTGMVAAPSLRGALSPGLRGGDAGPLETTPEGLDRAALEAAAGGAFFPGIEAGWVMRNPDHYMATEPFRLDHGVLGPGEVTQHMACPWQADFFECHDHWWPAQRPDDVLTMRSYEEVRAIDRRIAELAKHVDDPVDRQDTQDTLDALKRRRDSLWTTRVPWARGLPGSSPEGDESMVVEWHHLGFVVNQLPGGAKLSIGAMDAFVESERYEYLASKVEYFHYLINIDDHPGFRPKAHEIALEMLAEAKFTEDPSYAEFEYTPEAFDARLNKIYDDFVDSTMYHQYYLDSGSITWEAVIDLDEDDEPVYGQRRFEVGPFSNTALKERLKQLAPFNLIDGGWLENVTRTGPIDEVHARLFSIWADEAGDGKTELNHCNVYQTLLRNLDIYMPPITSRAFIEQDFLPSVFDGSLIELAVGLFPEEFFPELLGMTLYLEWEATPTLRPVARSLELRGLDPQFYRMHAAIDNISVGHGALIKGAVKAYLEQRREEGGDEAVAAAWKRIWRGYVAWATAGGLSDEILERMLLIDRKAIYIRTPLLQPLDILLLFLRALKDGTDPVSRYLQGKLSAETKAALDAADLGSTPAEDVLEALRLRVRKDINRAMRAEVFYAEERFAGVTLSAETQAMIRANAQPEGVYRQDLNRWLLQEAYPDGIAPMSPFPGLRAYRRQCMLDLVRRKAPVARQVHKYVSIGASGDVPLEGLFDDPDRLLEVLLQSHTRDGQPLFDLDAPRGSHFFELLGFEGPMYKVFTDDERQVVLDWLEAEGGHGVTATRPNYAQALPANPADAVLYILQSKIGKASGVAMHNNFVITAADGTSKTVREWAAAGSAAELMRALSEDPSWIVKKDPDASRFVTVALRMMPDAAFTQAERTVIVRWIKDGAPLPENRGPIYEAPFMVAWEPPITFGEKRSHIGSGAVH
jgi:hypothetical protein